jgi:hypothetical protein
LTVELLGEWLEQAWLATSQLHVFGVSLPYIMLAIAVICLLFGLIFGGD